MPTGDIEPGFDHLMGERQQAVGNASECIRGLEIDDNLKPHVQQRSPSVILRLEVLGLSTGRCNTLANHGNV